ncbi:MAG: inactive transglutaminase family protein [Candidatus Binatia bacterium]|nr:inactive transglutaminase family protein [Candidatus Binatia bacterium]MDG2011651.1 inactive transglutaminase family protein [Candidatus Binatia bacterium]
MRRDLHLFLLVSILLTTGLGMTFYQYKVLGWPLLPHETETLWTVEARIQFKADSGRPVIARFLTPDLDGQRVDLSESFVSRNYGVTIEKNDGQRESIWSIRRASGPQALYYRLVVTNRQSPDTDGVQQEASVPAPRLDGPEAVAIQALLDQIRGRSGNIATFTAAALKRLNDEADQNAQLLRGSDRSVENLTKTAVLVLNSANIPAREVHVLPLRTGSYAMPQTLLSAFDGEEWIYFDPPESRRTDSGDFLVWWAGTGKLLTLQGASSPTVSFSVSGSDASSLTLANEAGRISGSPWFEFSLFGLPLRTQDLYRVLMMIPVGVFLIVFLRSFVGIETFGTFMPALIALSFRETQLFAGIVLFSLLLAIGMIVRAYLEQLHLLLVPRLAVVVTVVVLIMAGVSVLSHRLDLESGLSVALFPMVIVTMTIERMSIAWEERGAWPAILVAAGSLFTAALVYLVMANALLTHLVFTFPGLLLVIMALMLLAGSYRGYRLNELLRFRAIADPRP